MRLRILAGVALLALGACRGQQAAPVDSETARSTASTAAASAAGQPWYLDPDEGCAFDTTVAHPDPDRLVTEYLARDAAGQFLQTDAWFAGATECPGHEPGPDSYVVISEYRSAPLHRGSDSVAYAVTSTVVGMMGPAGLRSDPRTVVDTVAAVRTPFGWRIASPALRQFVRRSALDSLRRAGPGRSTGDSVASSGR